MERDSLPYIIAIDAGTTSSRALLVNQLGKIIHIEQIPFQQYYPKPGYSEQDASEIWETQRQTLIDLIKKSEVAPSEIKGIGITNQRETTVIWERATGKPIHRAIVWNDRRTSSLCDELRKKYEETIKRKTGLTIDPFFSATKITWILDQFEGAWEKAHRGELLFGNINTWILWNLTKGKTFATDVTNASRTLLFNIHSLDWDEELLEIFKIPKELLPSVVSTSEVYGHTDEKTFGASIPISGMLGDQQASLFGNACFEKGDVKCTYGTCASIVMNTGTEPIESSHELLTAIAWQRKGQSPVYALDSIVYASGALVEWMKNSLNLFSKPKEIEELARSVENTGGVTFVPAIMGLASPYWDAHARGMLMGLSANSNKGHICRAALEGVAYQVSDIIEAMKVDAQTNIQSIRCGGGMSVNKLLLELQSNLIGSTIRRAKSKEMTGLGAAFMAGLAVGVWKDQKELLGFWESDGSFSPNELEKHVPKMKSRWKKAVALARSWKDA